MKIILSDMRIKLLRELLEPVAASDPDPERRRIAQGLLFSLNFEQRKKQA